jgi:methylmalonyl-CoA/ethylmalonyl-CoA epimerase
MNPQTGACVPRLRLHHTGLLVRDVERAAEGYARSLGYNIESPAIDDPVQTARVLFLRLPGATSWLELVAPIGPESRLAGALAKGAGLHHICYEADDLAAALAHFRAAGFMIIMEPVAATAFPGRRIAWVMDRQRLLIELLETGLGPLSLASLGVP